MSAPKKYKCEMCGHISNQAKKYVFEPMTLFACLKCEGPMKERKEWHDWVQAEQIKKMERR